MGMCRFCWNGLSPGEPHIHDACIDEWERRYASGLCTRCGRGKAASGFMCDDCFGADNGAPYSGYPGERSR